MRTTLTIDDDVLAAARAIAGDQKKSVGEVMSDLARRSLVGSQPPRERNGILLLPVREDDVGTVTLEMVNSLRDDLP